MSANHPTDRMAHAVQVFKDAGLKLTFQRIEIFKEISKTGDHPDAETIYRRVRERVSTISLDTVYRALWLFAELGLIETLGMSRERTRFDANLDRHHHFVCKECGRTTDFYSEDLNNIELPRSVKKMGAGMTLHVEVRGTCTHCDAGNKNTTNISKKRGKQ